LAMTPKELEKRFSEFRDFMLQNFRKQKEMVDNHKEDILKRMKRGRKKEDFPEIEKNFPDFIQKKKKFLKDKIAVWEAIK